MNMPSTYTDINETGCCAVPNIDAWDRQVIRMDERRFIRMHTRSLFFVPLNMGRVMRDIAAAAVSAGAEVPETEAMILSRDLSPWRAEQLYAVSKQVDGADNVILTGDFASRVFEGPYSKAKTWVDEIQGYAKELGRTPGDIYFFYTTCPKCAKHYGKNYVIALASLEQAPASA
ncbi:MAG: hydrolase [Candidatus Nanopelagicales bacterium]